MAGDGAEELLLGGIAYIEHALGFGALVFVEAVADGTRTSLFSQSSSSRASGAMLRR